VTAVHNHLEVVLPSGDYRDDAMLTTAANNALTQNFTVPPGIEATARDGNIELIGEVRYGSERVAAERAVAELTGVRNIKDYIDVIPDIDPSNVIFLVQGVERSLRHTCTRSVPAPPAVEALISSQSRTDDSCITPVCYGRYNQPSSRRVTGRRGAAVLTRSAVCGSSTVAT
jgi:hypothetical protein